MGDYEIREFRDGDETSLIETFNLVFGREDPSRPRLTLAEWRWLFEANPAGRRIFVALHEGRVVAQYAAIPGRVRVGGEDAIFSQAVDSMVHPEHRQGLKRPGLFVNTALPFFDRYGGPDKDVVVFGWPVEKAWRIGKTFLSYEMVRTQNVMAHALSPGDVRVPDEVEVVERFDEQARWLWERCCGAWGASAVRDEAFLNWRIVDHPRHDYTVYGVRDEEGILRGYVTYRRADWILPNMGVLVDWLVPPGEPEVAELLLRAATARGRADAVSSLATIVPEWSPWFDTLQRWGFLVWESDYFLVARNFDRRFDMLWLRDSWWYQLADTDLV